VFFLINRGGISRVLTVGVGSYGIACTACIGLIAMLSIGWITRHWTIVVLATALCLWAVLGLYVAAGNSVVTPAYVVSDVIRSAAFLILINHALQRLNGSTARPRDKHVDTAILLLSSALMLALGILSWTQHPDADFWRLIGHVGLSVAGLFMIENLLKASRPDALWSTKHLLIGAGAIYAFDLFYYTDALLLLRVDDTLRAAQPIIAVLAIPLILVSARRLQGVKIDLPVSRDLVVGTTALLASGIYILSIASIAYLIRELGWTWGPALQLIFLFGAAMVLLVLLSSTSLRHGGRRFIERNLFTFAYDYRREWLRLVESMAETQASERHEDPSLGQRALKTAAALIDADGGALFMRNANGNLHFKTSWNIALENRAPGNPPEALLTALSPAKPALIVDEAAPMAEALSDHPAIKEWLSAFRDPWVVLALIARNEVVGLALITRPRMRRHLTWEDLDILAIFAHQLGSYLAVEELARHVAEGEHFERMSKHVTFVAHDLKNVIGQLSLVLQQAKDHAHNPAFVSDTFLTIGDAVERMRRLMQKIQEDAGHTPTQPVNLQALINKISAAGRVDRLALPSDDIVIDAEPSILQALLDHIIDNAWEAVDAKAGKAADDTSLSRKAYLVVDPLEDTRTRVTLTLRRDDRHAIIEITDIGIGMTSDFIQTDLFKPFKSTKQAGFGIGMYQCRDSVEGWQGRLEVDSEPGKGTTIKVILPLAERDGIDTHILRTASGVERAREHAA
jgi:putative PEP-CTERM system histidine kinase